MKKVMFFDHIVVIYVLCLINICQANTETILIKIPQYFEVPAHADKFETSELFVHTLNSTHSFIEGFPIIKAGEYSTLGPLNVDYDPLYTGGHKLLIRLNNYQNITFQAGDVLYAKLCWPSTIPVSIELNPIFYYTGQILGNSENSFDLYLEVGIIPDVYAVDKSWMEEYHVLKFNLQITKLYFKALPVPPELCVTIRYLVGIAIVTYRHLIPLILDKFIN